MAIIRLARASLMFGEQIILDDVDFALRAKERVALLGQNGTGKSTLMRVLLGVEAIDEGNLIKQNDLIVSYLPQSLPPADETHIFDYLADGLADVGDLLKSYEKLTHQELDQAGLKKLDTIQKKIDHTNAWQMQQQIYNHLKALKLDANTTLSSLSGGWRKRLSIVRTLLSNPDLLLLDEPTNHLDIPGIEWLQQLLNRADFALIVISHDRRFFDSIAESHWWLDRGHLHCFSGNYANFIKRRDTLLALEERHNADFDKKLTQEEQWIRQGIKARRTRNEGRVRALKAMREKYRSRRQLKGKVSFRLEQSLPSGQLVAELKNVDFDYDGENIIKDVSLSIRRGDKLAIIGKNGAGKTTLLQLILGQLQATKGSIRLGTNLSIAYFDQNRDQLNENDMILDVIAQGRQSIEFDGKEKHVISYLNDFLFKPQQLRSTVSTLSGGEKNRLLLAKIFTKSVNVLVLDEPSNDLDIETLELLQELLCKFTGTIILISHDRELIDQVVSNTIFIDDNKHVHSYVGGFDDLVRQHGALWPALEKEKKKTKTNKPKSQNDKKTKKLTYKEQLELKALPTQIEQLEKEIEQLEKEASSPEFYQQDYEVVQKASNILNEKQKQLSDAYDRWSLLEQLDSQ